MFHLVCTYQKYTEIFKIFLYAIITPLCRDQTLVRQVPSLQAMCREFESRIKFSKIESKAAYESPLLDLVEMWESCVLCGRVGVYYNLVFQTPTQKKN